MGEATSVGDRAVINGASIGKMTLVGARATIAKGCVVGDGCSVGLGATLSADCTIGDGAIISAGAVLPPKTTVPPRTLWGGAPAVQMGTLGEGDEEGLADAAVITQKLSTLHRHAAWMAPEDIELEAEDYKRESDRTPLTLSQMRYDPKWVPLPTLGQYLEEIGAYDATYVPK